MNILPRVFLAAIASTQVGLSLFAQAVPASRSAAGAAADEVLELSPFVISSAADDDNRVTESTSGTLVSRPLDKLPMGIQVVSAELMKQLDILNADSLGRVVPGLANQNQTTSEGTGNNTQYASRGFTVLPRRNGFAPGGRLYDMTGIDRVEVIRGPNSLLYGQSDAGGIINYITKRPRIRTTTGARGSASVAAGNYAFYRAQFDVDYTLIPGKLGFRLPASFTSNEREFNFFRNKVIAYNPSILFRPFANTEVSFEYEYLDVKTNFGAFQPIVWIPPGSTVEFVDKDSRGLGRAARGGLFGPYAKAENEQTNWTADITSRLTENITFRGVYSKNTRDRNELVPTGGDPFRVTPVPYYGANTKDGNRITGYKGDLLGEWDIGPFKTRSVLGYEYNKNIFFASIWRGWNAATNARDNIFTLNLGYDPVTGKVTRPPTAADFRPFNGVSGDFLDTRLDPALWRLEVGPQRFQSEWTNLRVSEVLSGYDDRLQILAGVARGESTLTNTTTGAEDARKKTVFQAGVGYSFDPKKQHMLFVNRSTSYQPQFLFDINFNPLAPLTAEGIEGGLKSTWGETGLSTMIVVYTQERKNVGRQFQDFSLNPPRTYGVLTPGEEAKGVEFEAWYKATNNLSFTFLYAQFDGKITGVQPGREFLIGRELPRAPEKAANVFVNYKIDGDGVLGNTRWTLGANWKNDTWLDLGQGQNTLPRRSDGGAIVFVVISKEFKLANKRAFTLRLNVGNIFDRDYISEGFTFGDKRSWRLATDFRF
ncbi:MAG TPA: TonB-dependent receptor [Opitutaceae bacterium]|jgi:iron complex outermembrane receptor protein|nr:TonB-dependent receptor [Opitutaceae bacterium]HRE04952.1 TonB-dependent receptor [Opitutaceae bacterium]